MNIKVFSLQVLVIMSIISRVTNFALRYKDIYMDNYFFFGLTIPTAVMIDSIPLVFRGDSYINSLTIAIGAYSTGVVASIAYPIVVPVSMGYYCYFQYKRFMKLK